MFGMSSEEFWEQDPQLYWAFRTFYLKKLEVEQKNNLERLKYESWLNGFTTYIAQSISLGNAFSKQKQHYPSYDKMFGDTPKKKEKVKSQNEINKQVQAEFNAWARY